MLLLATIFYTVADAAKMKTETDVFKRVMQQQMHRPNF